MEEHISLELAKWLKERGCTIESKMVWTEDFEVSSYRDDIRAIKNGKWLITPPFMERCDIRNGLELPAYTWWEILVKNPERFFGSRVQEGVHPSHAIFYALQEGDVEKAESIVRKHSIFANKQL